MILNQLPFLVLIFFIFLPLRRVFVSLTLRKTTPAFHSSHSHTSTSTTPPQPTPSAKNHSYLPLSHHLLPLLPHPLRQSHLRKTTPTFHSSPTPSLSTYTTPPPTTPSAQNHSSPSPCTLPTHPLPLYSPPHRSTPLLPFTPLPLHLLPLLIHPLHQHHLLKTTPTFHFSPSPSISTSSPNPNPGIPPFSALHVTPPPKCTSSVTPSSSIVALIQT